MVLKKFKEVYDFAAKAHEGQVRMVSNEPYITHPLAVAQRAEGLGADDTTVKACLLHDVVEDCDFTLEDIKEKFGDEVAYLVDGVTELETPEKTLEKLRAFSLKDKRVFFIKIVDRIHNTQSAMRHNVTKIIEKFKIYNPGYVALGRELGLNDLADELEDLTGKLFKN